MKTIALSLLCIAALAIAPRAEATANLYVSPSGSDSNDCLTAVTACQTPNRAILRTGGIVQDNVIINFDVGTYYSPAYASDGGAPNALDAKALIDLEGLAIPGDGTLTLLGSTQQVNPPGLVVGAIDAGTLATAGSKKYEGWVQIAIDGGWATTGGYANDAGYCYMDGGACVLQTNALATAGAYISFTTGAGLITAPIVSNTTGAGATTINYVIHGNGYGAPTAPTAASTFNVFTPASHFKPWPVDGGASTAYTFSSVYLGTFASTSAAALTTNPVGGQDTGGAPHPVTVQYLDFVGAPESVTLSDFAIVDNFGLSNVDFVNTTLQPSNGDFAVNNYNGRIEFDGSLIKGDNAGSTAGIESWGGAVWAIGNLVTGVVPGFKVIGSLLDAEADVVVSSASASGASVQVNQQSRLIANGLFVDQGNAGATAPVISMLNNSSAILSGFNEISDGGAGAIRCGSVGQISLISVGIPDAGANEISTDNGATYISQTTRLAQDGGTAGVNAFVNAGSGCTYTSY